VVLLWYTTCYTHFTQFRGHNVAKWAKYSNNKGLRRHRVGFGGVPMCGYTRGYMS